MKNIIVFYLATFLPIFAIVWWPNKPDDSYLFLGLTGIYLFIYKPFIDGLRLYQKGFINKKQFIKAFIPGYVSDKIENSLTELYFKR